ncbi:hypothetical protein, partial [Kangiella spongicola]|uniref:hypothetical protein n=1 Tax=Kangiella spongicola TaxID=796379 RepID=UPI0011B209C4
MYRQLVFPCRYGALLRARYSKALLSRPSGRFHCIQALKPTVCQPMATSPLFKTLWMYRQLVFPCRYGALLRARYSKALLSRPSGRFHC